MARAHEGPADEDRTDGAVHFGCADPLPPGLQLGGPLRREHPAPGAPQGPPAE